MKSTNKLTICSVDYNSKSFLDLNWRLTNRLNSTDDFTWLVADNNLGFFEKQLNENDYRFQVIKGDRYDETIKIGPECFHHAAGLSKLLPHISTRFVLFLDPDFYIVRKQWISEIISYMKLNKLSFFGAPWNPRWFAKWRYFPCTHCLFVDLDKVNIKSLDFKPKPNKIIKDRSDSAKQERNLYFMTIMRKISAKLRRLLQLLLNIFKVKDLLRLEQRKTIGSNADTGYSISQQYRESFSFQHECVVPVFKPNCAFKQGRDYVGQIKGIDFFGSLTNRIIEKLLPDYMCFIPKRRGYYSKVGFCDLGYFDVSAQGWEEFLWQGKPFSFHLRNFPKIISGTDAYSQLPDLKKAIECFYQKERL